MLKKLRKSSGTVTLVLIGVAALAGCSDDEQRRDVYASKEDCLADWGNKPEDCTPATDPKHASSGHYYGPLYAAGGFLAGRNWSSSGSSRSFANSRSIGSSSSGSSSGTSSSSRGGFGSTGRSSSSSSGG